MCFVATLLAPPSRVQAAGDSTAWLPPPGSMVDLSPAFEPVLLKGLKIDPATPFSLDLILDTGHTGLSAADTRLNSETRKLIKYFLAAMTVPEKDLWVNLSPYEKDRMIAPNLGETEMGRDMLAQDYFLKQLTASLIYPEKEFGKAFWDRVYAKAQPLYADANVAIPVNTFNKVWIVADQADVFESGNAAYVVGAHLKVMLEEDYLALNKNNTSATSPKGTTTAQVIRDIVLPEIEREVNTGQHFAPLRQMFYAMILASWYKMVLKDALFTQIYGNQSKVKVGINAADPTAKDKIFDRYLQAYKKGVFNYIKQDTKPRKYFSGGTTFAKLAKTREEGGVLNLLKTGGPAIRGTGRLMSAYIQVWLPPMSTPWYVKNATAQMWKRAGLDRAMDADLIVTALGVVSLAVLVRILAAGGLSKFRGNKLAADLANPLSVEFVSQVGSYALVLEPSEQEIVVLGELVRDFNANGGNGNIHFEPASASQWAIFDSSIKNDWTGQRKLAMELAKAASSSTEQANAAMSAAQPENTKTVLVVDEDLSFRGGLATRYKDLGYDVQEASSGQEALGILKKPKNKNREFFVVSAVDLVDMEGKELIRKIQADPKLITRPAFILMGNDLSPERVDAIKRALSGPSDSYVEVYNKSYDLNSIINAPHAHMPLDNAMGGIDFNRQKMRMNVQKQGRGVQTTLDPAMIEHIRTDAFDGFDFTIRSILPLPKEIGREQFAGV